MDLDIPSPRFLFSQACLVVHLFLLRILRFIRHTLLHLTLPSNVKHSPYSRTVVIIGDGLAEGVGDSLVYGGLENRLQKLLKEHQQSGELKMSWDVVSLGRLHADSRTWAVSQGASLFDQTFVTGKGKDAHIVVIICGGGEDLEQMQETVDRIGGTAEALVRLGKQVIVASIPFYGERKSAQAQQASERNRLLRRAIEGISANDQDGARAVCGLDLQGIVNRGPDVLRQEKNFVVLNPSGYRSLARLLMDEILNPARREEWKFWKPRLRMTRAPEISDSVSLTCSG